MSEIIIGISFRSNESIPVENSRSILNWLCEDSMNGHKNSKKSLSINLDNEFKEFFGKRISYLMLEYPTKVWVLHYGEEIYNIFCSKRGTSIEIVGHFWEEVSSGAFDDKILEFLNALSQHINQ